MDMKKSPKRCILYLLTFLCAAQLLHATEAPKPAEQIELSAQTHESHNTAVNKKIQKWSKEITNHTQSWEDKVTYLREILAEYDGSQIDPETQQIYFDAIQKIYISRLESYEELMGESTDLSQLKQTLAEAAKSSFVSSRDKETIARFINTLSLEELIFASGNEKTYQKQLDKISTILDRSKDYSFDKYVQVNFFNKMYKILNTKKLDTYRNDLATMGQAIKTLQKTLTTPLMTKQQQRYIEKNVYLPQQTIFYNSLLQERIKQALNGKEYNDKLAGLLALSKEQNSFPLSGETQNQFLSALQSLYDQRSTTNQHQLQELKEVCTSALNSPLLSSSQKKEVERTFTSTIKETIRNLEIQSTISYASSQVTHIERIKGLEDVFKKIGKVSLNEQTKTLLSNACLQLFKQRDTNEESLEHLKKFYKSINKNQHLTQVCDIHIEKELIPSLKQELDNKAFHKDISTLQAESSQQRMASLHKILQKHRNKELNEENQKLITNTLNELFTHRNQETQDLTILHDFFLKIKQIPLLSQKEQTTIVAEYLPTLKRDQNDLELSAHLADATDFYQINERIDAVITTVQKTYEKNYSTISKDLLSTVLNDLVDQRLENKITLSKLNELLNVAQKSSALSGAQKKHVQNKLLPIVLEDLDVVNLKRASALPEYLGKITELSQYVNSSKTIFSPRVNDAYIQAIHKAFDQRPNENLAELKELKTLLEKSEQRLIDNSEKKQVTQQFLPLVSKDINSLSFEHEVHAAMAQKSTSDKLKLLPEIVSRYADKTVAESSQKLLSESMQSLFDQRYASHKKQEISEKMKITKNMLQFFKNAYTTTTLTSADKQHLVKNLIPKLSSEETGLSLQAKIEHITKSTTNCKIIEGLKELIDETKGLTYNAETQDCYAHHIQQLTQRARTLDTKTLHDLENLLAYTQESTLLSPSQCHFVMTKLLPSVSSIIVQQDLDRIMQNEPSKQIEELNQLVHQCSNTVLLPETQDAYGQVLQNLNRKAEGLDPQSVDQFSQLLHASTETSLLTPTQQSYVKNAMIPTMKAATIPQQIQLITNKQNINSQIDHFSALINDSHERSYAASTKNAFGAALVALSKSSKQLDTSTHAKLDKLLHAATQSSLLSAEQKTFFQSTILPSVTLAPSPQTIHHIMASSSLSDQLASLRKVVLAAEKSCCPETQNTFGSTLVQLSQTASQLQSEERENLVDLLKLSANSPLLSFAQQRYFKKTILPDVVQEATPASIHRIMSDTSADNQITALIELIQYSKGREYSPATKNTFGSSLVQLSKQAEKLSFPTRANLQRLILKATKTPLLTAAQQNFFKETILPTVAIHATPQSINELLHHGTVSDQIAWLKSLLKLTAENNYNAQTRNTFGKSLVQIAHKNNTMNEHTRNKLMGLLVKAGNSPLLSLKQQEYVKNTMVPLIYKETTP